MGEFIRASLNALPPVSAHSWSTESGAARGSGAAKYSSAGRLAHDEHVAGRPLEDACAHRAEQALERIPPSHDDEISADCERCFDDLSCGIAERLEVASRDLAAQEMLTCPLDDSTV